MHSSKCRHSFLRHIPKKSCSQKFHKIQVIKSEEVLNLQKGKLDNEAMQHFSKTTSKV